MRVLCFANWLSDDLWRTDHWYYMACDNQCVIIGHTFTMPTVLRLLQSELNVFTHNFSVAIDLSPKASLILLVMYVFWLQLSKVSLTLLIVAFLRFRLWAQGNTGLQQNRSFDVNKHANSWASLFTPYAGGWHSLATGLPYEGVS